MYSERKKESDDIYGLIHSMGKLEKRYFTLRNYTEPSKKSFSISLYDLISEHSITSDEHLKSLEEARRLHEGKNLAHEKRRLLKKLMESIRGFHENKTPEIQRRNLLSNVQLLDARGKTRLALSELKTLKKKCYLAEHWAMLIEVLEFERRLVKTRSKGYAGEELTLLSQERADAFQHLNTDAMLKETYDQLLMVQWTQEKGNFESKLKELKPKICQIEYNPSWCWTNQMAYFNVIGLWDLLHQRREESFQAYQKAVRLFEAHPSWIEENHRSTLLQYYNLLNIAHSVGEYGLFPELVPKIERLEREISRYSGSQTYYSTTLQAIYFSNTGNVQQALEYAMEIQYPTGKSNLGFPHSNHQANRFNLFILQFLNGNFSEANASLDKFLNDTSIKLRVDLAESLRVFEPIIQYELGNDLIAENKIKSLKRKKIKSVQIEKIISPISLLFKHILNPPFDPFCWQKAYESLNRFREEKPKLESQGINTLIIWIRSKMEKRSMIEIINESGR